MHAALRAVDGLERLEEIRRAHWGGGFTFRDPEGNVWEAASAEGTRLDADGALTWF